MFGRKKPTPPEPEDVAFLRDLLRVINMMNDTRRLISARLMEYDNDRLGTHEIEQMLYDADQRAWAMLAEHVYERRHVVTAAD